MATHLLQLPLSCRCLDTQLEADSIICHAPPQTEELANFHQPAASSSSAHASPGGRGAAECVALDQGQLDQEEADFSLNQEPRCLCCALTKSQSFLKIKETGNQAGAGVTDQLPGQRSRGGGLDAEQVVQAGRVVGCPQPRRRWHHDHAEQWLSPWNLEPHTKAYTTCGLFT